MIPAGQGQPAQADVNQEAVRDAEPLDWPTALTLGGPEQDAALRRLHELMLKAARHQVWRMRGMLHEHGPDFYDDLANSAADEALTVLLMKLDTFQGRSRFTTWGL